jgi:hypothetical protein
VQRLGYRSHREQPIRILPDEIEPDTKMLWPSYKASIQAGTDFLFELGKPGIIQPQCKQAIVWKEAARFALHP